MSAKGKWIKRLHSLIADMRANKRRVEYPAKRVFELVDAPNFAELNEELTKLVVEGKLDAVYRIRSRETGVGIAEYHSISEIPRELFDETADRFQDVVLGRDVEMIYRPPNLNA